MEYPAFLALLALAPALFLWSWRSLAGLGATRRWVALSVRILVVMFFVLALTGVSSVRRTDDQTVVFLLDTSRSVSPDLQQSGFEFAKQATQSMRPGKDRAAFITFGGAGSVEQLADDALHVEQFKEGPQPHQTDLASALRLATAILPPDSARRVVLLSDGNQNAGDGLHEAEHLRAAGVPVDVLPLSYAHDREVLVERLAAPASATVDETIDLSVVLHATRPTSGRILLYHNEQLVDLDPSSDRSGSAVDLLQGPNRLSIPTPLRSAGVHRFRAVFEPDNGRDDNVVANNEGRAMTIVGGKPRVLVLGDFSQADRPDERESALLFQEALEKEGFECETRDVQGTRIDPASLLDYSLVVLSNVSAITLSEDGQLAIASYVRDLGGGLIVLGGDQAFSVGGYFRTPLEEVLPVETDRRKLQMLGLSMVVVLDCSGSMCGDKIDLAKIAAIGAVDLLCSLDRLGVVTFNSGFDWVVPFARCTNKDAIQAKLRRIGASGGTDMYPALEQAAAALAAVDSGARHVVLLTDGQSTPGEFDKLAGMMASAGVTISSIAVGPDADRVLLKRLAEKTGGRMYVTTDARSIPRVFARETVLASRSGLYERAFTPVLRRVSDDSIVGGLTQADVPPLKGHVITLAKPFADTPLVRVTEDGVFPVLAHWKVGLGRAVAFTSGMWPRWGASWTSWPGFPKLWGQAARWASRPVNSGEVEVDTLVQGGRVAVTLSTDVVMAGDLRVGCQVVGPDFKPRTLDVRQTGPGCYEGAFDAVEPGWYIVRSAYQVGQGDQARSGVAQTGVCISYGAEWADLRSDETTLTEIARRTQGRLLDADYPEAVYEPWSIRPIETSTPLWDFLTRIALITFLVDVAVRRLALQPSEVIGQLRQAVQEMAGARASEGAVVTLASLKGARGRSRGTQAKPTVEPKLGDAASSTGRPIAMDVEAPERKQAAEPGEVGEGGEHTSRLLNAKRRTRRSFGGDDSKS